MAYTYQTGFNIPPEVFAQLAAAGFRPPQAPQMPGFNMQAPQMQQPQQQGFGMGQGAEMLGAGLGAVGRMPAAASPGVPTSNGDPTGGAGPAYLGGSSSIMDPLQPPKSNFWSWLPWN